MKALGIIALKRIYKDVGLFSKEDGLAWAITRDGQWLHIRPDGTPAYEQRYTCAFSFSCGVATVFKGQERVQIRPDGTEIKPP
jgi:hypothetical protein